MTGRFSSFVIIGAMRTGSNFLETTLNSVPGVAGHGELFNPEFIGRAQQTELLGYDLAARDAEPLQFLAKVRAADGGLSGFRIFDDHDVRVLADVLDDVRCAKILLSRNPVDSYVSLLIAQETGQWKLGHVRALRQAVATFDIAGFEDYLRDVQAFHSVVRNRLQVTGQVGFQIDYDDLGNVEVLNGMLSWLGVSARLEQVAGNLKRQNPEPLREKLTNPEILDQIAARFDLLNLIRTPMHEPRRAPLGQGVVALRRLGLVFLPIAGGPQEPVVRWMGGLIRGGVEQGLNRASYPKWKASHPGARAFTVLRHPLLRGWRAYRTLLADEKSGVLRGHLQRTLKIDLPAPDAGVAEHRVGFLAYLRFVRMVMAGQAALRAPAHWASQASQIEAYSGLQPPDFILREDQLQAGLLLLARQSGAPRRPGYTAEPLETDLLAQVLCDDIAQAARQAWPRDYQAFGFVDWVPPQAG
jgi:LPS sulfotransferase NodH